MSSAPPLPPYSKPWQSSADQVILLQSRGLIVSNPQFAADFLSHINYYRFSGYCLAFEQARHQFLPGTTFDQIRASYDFDRILRDLVSEAVEITELDFRSAIADHFGRTHGPFGHIRPASFFRLFRHADWLNKLREESERSRELFVTHFRKNYAEFPDLPIWMATEVMSFGQLSRMFSGMDRTDQRAIAPRYGIQPSILMSWMHHFVYVRNLCAHHSRLWDRVWAIKADLPAGKAWNPPLLPGNERLFSTMLMLFQLLKRCPAISQYALHWRQRVHTHLATPPIAPQARNRMGLTPTWNQHPLWT